MGFNYHSVTLLSKSLCWIAVASAMLLGSASVVDAQYDLHPHKVVRVSPPSATLAVEVSIAINPTDKNNIVAGAIMRGYAKSKVPNYTWHSIDGGNTWGIRPTENPDDRTQGDDVVVFSEDGTAIHGYISFKGIWGGKPKKTATGIFIDRSTDKGETWSPQVPVVNHINTPTPMEDKPWFVFDRNKKSPHFGNLYCSWTRFDVYGSKDAQDTTQIVFSRSVDDGKSFQPVIRISDQGGDCVDGDDTVEGATPSCGPDGTLYCVWSGPRGLEMDLSKDGGETWGKDKVIGKQVGGWANDVEGIGRSNGMPVTAVDHSDGLGRGTLYVNFVDERNGDKDVFLMKSADGGKTWSEPLQVNETQSAKKRDQFFTWLAVDPSDGSVNIVYYDRELTAATGTRVTLSRSTDQGKTFSHYRVGDVEFECTDGPFFGDYIGIDALDGRVALAFMHFVDKKKTAVSSAVFDFGGKR